METVTEEAFGIIPLSRVKDTWSIFVILHKHGDHWGFPKGKGEEGESALESAIRELKEETGLAVKQLLTEAPIIEEYSFQRKGQLVQKKVHYFPAIVSGAFFLQPEEIRDGRWLTLDEAPARLTFAEARSILQRVLPHLTI